jgi:MFS family permease
MAANMLGPSAVTHKNRRGWLIAFGIVEILISCFLMLIALLVLVLSLLLPHLKPQSLPEESPLPLSTQLVLGAVLYGFTAAVLLAIGVGSIKCKNWARIAMLVVSGFWLGSGVVSTLLFSLLLPPIIDQQSSGLPQKVAHAIVVTTIAAEGFFMLLVPAVFLIFYSLKSVKATCLSHGPVQIPTGAKIPASAMPVPVIIVLVWEGLGVFGLVFFFIFPVAVILGVVLQGLGAFLVLFAQSALSALAVWLIYRRDFLGWAVAFFKIVFWTTSAVVTFAGHDLMQLYYQMGMSKRQLRPLGPYPQVLSIIWVCSCLIPAGYLIFLWYAKKFFPRTVGRSPWDSARP